MALQAREAYILLLQFQERRDQRDGMRGKVERSA